MVCGLAVMQNGTLEVRKASRIQELRCSLNRRRIHFRKVVSLEVWTRGRVEERWGTGLADAVERI